MSRPRKNKEPRKCYAAVEEKGKPLQFIGEPEYCTTSEEAAHKFLEKGYTFNTIVWKVASS